jgi:hypothetical protein
MPSNIWSAHRVRVHRHIHVPVAYLRESIVNLHS